MNYIAFDIGGTDVKYGILNQNGDILKKDTYTTPKDLETFLEMMINVIDNEREGLEGIAISFPGAVDSESGIIHGFSALPYIHGPNFKDIIKEKTGFIPEIENDANCAALAEVWLGNAKGKKDSILVVIGTGIGGAIVKDGKIHRGINLHGGEIGYMISEIKANGEYDIWSDTASTRALVNKMASLSGRDKKTLNGRLVFQEAEAGNEHAIEAIDYFYTKLAQGIYNLQYIYDPEVILLGGSISARSDLAARVEEKVEAILKSVKVAKVKPTIRNCKFMGDSNLIGALYHWFQRNNITK